MATLTAYRELPKTEEDAKADPATLAHLAIALTCAATGVPIAAVLSPNRSGPAALARHIACHIARIVFEFSDTDLAVGFGRDRTTFRYGAEKISALRDEGTEIDHICTAIEAACLKIPLSRKAAIDMAADLWWM